MDVIHVVNGLCLLKSDWVEILPILKSLMPHFHLLKFAPPVVRDMDPTSKQLRTYYASVLNSAFDKLTRALWPSVSYWTLTDWMNRKVDPLDAYFHQTRFSALTSK